MLVIVKSRESKDQIQKEEFCYKTDPLCMYTNIKPQHKPSHVVMDRM